MSEPDKKLEELQKLNLELTNQLAKLRNRLQLLKAIADEAFI